MSLFALYGMVSRLASTAQRLAQLACQNYASEFVGVFYELNVVDTVYFEN